MPINSNTNTLALYPFSAEMIHSRMKEVLHSSSSDFDEIFTYLLQRKGKMLRPRLAIMCASLGKCEANTIRDMAVAVELIHLASLIHDDIIDRAVIRRGQESINQRWGNHASVLTGDFLFAAAFQLINLHNMQAVMDEVTRTIQIMCTGEIRQMAYAYHDEISEDDYFQKIYEKTACLFAAACKVGALTAGLKASEVHSLYQFGLSLGYAFQILDDLLDFVSDSTLLGKPVGTDLMEGNITLPVIHALQHPDYGDWLKAIISKKKITDKQLQRVIGILFESGAIHLSLQQAQEHIQSASGHLQALPGSSASKELYALGNRLLNDYYRKIGPKWGREQVVLEC